MSNSREAAKPRRNVEELSAIAVDCGYRLHLEVGTGLLESVYEAVLAKMLLDKRLKVERQKAIPIQIMGLFLNEGFRADLIIEDSLLPELKSVENLAPVHSKQLLTYLRLGFFLNFGAATFKEGCKRIFNNHTAFASSRLRVNQNRQPLDATTNPPISETSLRNEHFTPSLPPKWRK